MARMTAAMLRSLARETMISGGGRGFMRFLDSGDMLLVTDAPRRSADDTQKDNLMCAFAGAGFACREQDGLMLLAPGTAMLEGVACPSKIMEPDWNDPRCGVHALALRWLSKETKPLTPEGRQLILDCLRLTWQPEARVIAGCMQLRAQAAVMQRNRDYSGLREAGAILYDWCQEGRGNED